MVGNNLIAPGSIPPSARPPNLPASRKNCRLWFSSPASHVEHNSEKWRVESSFEWYLEKNTNFMFLCHCWFSILSSLFTPKKLRKSCVFWKLSEESRPSWQHCVTKAASPVWAGLVQAQYRPPRGTHSGVVGFPDSCPSTPEVGGAPVEQLCHQEFAKSDSPSPLLLVMCSQRLGAFVL